MRFLQTIQCVSVALLLGAATAIDLAQAVALSPTQGTPPETLIAQARKRRLRFRLGLRPSRTRIGGLSRGPCRDIPQTLAVAFAPPPRSDERLNEKENAAVDTTLSDRPVLWIYVKSMPAKTPVQFTLQASNQKTLTGYRQIYTTRFEVSGTGLVGVQIPKTVEALKVGEAYTWQTSIECTPGDPSGNVTLESWIQRVEPNRMQANPDFDPRAIVRKLAQATEQEKPFLYAELGVWQDAVTALIDLRRKQPNNQELKENWRELLTQTQLGEFATVPILGVK